MLLSVGEVNKNKNHRVVIEALPELNDCWYVLCGRGPLMDQHRKLAELLGVSDRFVMTGYRTDVTNFYKMADIFVFPSYREGLPVALMEAMAARLPCVAARNRGTNDLLESSNLLFVVNDRGAIISKLKDAKENDHMSVVADSRESLKNFDLSSTLVNYKAMYEQVML